jgi:hypothetical protein
LPIDFRRHLTTGCVATPASSQSFVLGHCTAL